MRPATRIALTLLLGVAAAVVVAPMSAYAAAVPWRFSEVTGGTSASANAEVNLSVACPSGDTVVSGGVYSAGFAFKREYEYPTYFDVPPTYNAEILNGPTAQLLHIVAECAPSSSVGTIYTATADFSRDTSTGLAGGWVGCQAGTRVIGGSEDWNKYGSREVDYAGPWSDGTSWYATGRSSVTGNSLHVEAYCIAASDLSTEQLQSFKITNPGQGSWGATCANGQRVLTGGIYGAPAGGAVDPYTYTGTITDSYPRTKYHDWVGYAPRNSPISTDVYYTAWCIPASVPSVSFTSGPGTITKQTSATFDYSGSDPVGYPLTYTCYLDEVLTSCGSSTQTTFAFVASGSHTFRVDVTNAENYYGEATYAWTVDTTAPTVMITNNPASYTHTTSASFTFDFTDAHPPSTWHPMCKIDSASATACASATTMSYAGPLSDGMHMFTVSAPDAAGNVGMATYQWTVDTHAPTVTASAPKHVFTLGTSTAVTWSGADNSGGSGIAHFQVREREAAWNSGFTPWTIPTAWQALSAATTQVTANLATGDDSCYEIRAIDRANNASPWTPERCTARPLDDRSLTLATSGWARKTATGYYLGTYTSTSHSAAELTRAGAVTDRVALLATHCPTCGKVAIYAGSTLIGNVNLDSSTTTKQVLSYLPGFSLRTTTLLIKVTTSGKAIPIDGLGISRT